MTPSRPRLVDTMRARKGTTPSEPVAVADTFATKRQSEPQKETMLTRRTTIYLSDDSWKRLKIRSVEEGTNVSQIIENLVVDYLDKKKR